MSTTDGATWSDLSIELQMQVLSLLPVPALCRSRLVCTEWNALFRRATFLNLCDANISNNGYLFVTRHNLGDTSDDAGWCMVDDNYRRTLCFLDIAEKHWYAIPADGHLAPLENTAPRLLAANDGLVCELCALPDDNGKCDGWKGDYKVILLDPVAKSRRELSADGDPSFSHVCDHLPNLVPVVDNATSSFKVFLLNGGYTRIKASATKFFLYESSTGSWRGLRNPPEPPRLSSSSCIVRGFENSVVVFQGKFYKIEKGGTRRLLSYDLEDNRWRQVLEFAFRWPRYPQLHVFNDRLFMGEWGPDPASYLPDRPEPCELQDFYESSSTRDDDLMYEIKEVLVNENPNQNVTTRLVVQIPGKALIERFREFDLLYMQFAFVTSNVVVIISGSTGKAITYDVASGFFGGLPEHPMDPLKTSTEPGEQKLEFKEAEPYDPVLYRAKLMNLSLRNALSRGPVTN